MLQYIQFLNYIINYTGKHIIIQNIIQNTLLRIYIHNKSIERMPRYIFNAIIEKVERKITTKNDAKERRSYLMAIRIFEMVMKCRGNYRMRKKVSEATLASKSLRSLPYLSRNFIYYSAQADEMNCKFEFKDFPIALCKILHIRMRFRRETSLM